MIKNSDSYLWFSKLTPEQFSRAYKSHQAFVQQKRAYSKSVKIVAISGGSSILNTSIALRTIQF